MWSICSLSYHLKTRHVCIWSSYVVLWNGKQNMFYVLFLTMGPRGSYKVVPCSIDPTFSQNVHCPLRYLRSLTLITFTIVSWELTIITIRVSITQKTHAHFILWNKESLSPSLNSRALKPLYKHIVYLLTYLLPTTSCSSSVGNRCQFVLLTTTYYHHCCY